MSTTDDLCALLAQYRILTIPFCFLAGAFLWQLLPSSVYLRLMGWPRLTMVMGSVVHPG